MLHHVGYGLKCLYRHQRSSLTSTGLAILRSIHKIKNSSRQDTWKHIWEHKRLCGDNGSETQLHQCFTNEGYALLTGLDKFFF